MTGKYTLMNVCNTFLEQKKKKKKKIDFKADPLMFLDHASRFGAIFISKTLKYWFGVQRGRWCPHGEKVPL